MKKIVFTIIPIIFVILLVSCAKDDEPEQQQQEQQIAPDEFIVIPETSFNSVSISWIAPTGENNQNLRYSIFLDNELIEDDNVLTTYTIDGLEIATNYTLKIIAKNENGETPVEVGFETLDPEDYTFLLETYQNGQNRPVISYFYNARKLIRKAEDTSKYTGEIVTYVYDEAGNLVKERFVQSYLAYGGEAECTYENGQIIDYSYVDAGDLVSLYDFISPDNYIIEDYFFTNLVSTSEVNLERSNGKITSCRVTDVDTQEVTYHYNFLYEDGNLVGRNNVLTGDIWTYEYDDKNNFISNKGFIRKPGLGINHLSNYEIYFLNGVVPEFVDYFNKNNPTAVYKNGVLIHELTYEYTVFDYPSKIYVDGSNDPVLLTYTFVAN